MARNYGGKPFQKPSSIAGFLEQRTDFEKTVRPFQKSVRSLEYSERLTGPAISTLHANLLEFSFGCFDLFVFISVVYRYRSPNFWMQMKLFFQPKKGRDAWTLRKNFLGPEIRMQRAGAFVVSGSFRSGTGVKLKNVNEKSISLRRFADAAAKAPAEQPPRGVPWKNLTVSAVRETFQGWLGFL